MMISTDRFVLNSLIKARLEHDAVNFRLKQNESSKGEAGRLVKPTKGNAKLTEKKYKDKPTKTWDHVFE